MMPKLPIALLSWAIGGFGVWLLHDPMIYGGVILLIISHRLWHEGFK